MNKKVVILASCVGIGLALVASMIIQSQYLKTAAVPQAINEENGELDPTEQEKSQYCEAVKQAHITHCGNAAPEDDHACRNGEAQSIFENCLTEAQNEEVSIFIEEPQVYEE